MGTTVDNLANLHISDPRIRDKHKHSSQDSIHYKSKGSPTTHPSYGNKGYIKQKTTDEVLKELPRSQHASSNAKAIIRCKYKKCTAASTDETLGYCNKHFTRLHNRGQLDIPTKEHVEAYQQDRRQELTRSRSPVRHTDGITESVTEGRYSETTSHDRYVRTAKSTRHERNDGPRCLGSRCNNRGLDTNNGLCHDCYKALMTKRAKSIPPPVPDCVTYLPPADQPRPYALYSKAR